MELALIEFKLYVQAFFNSYLHLYRPIDVWLDPDVWHNEFLLFRYAIIVSVYHHIYEVAQLDHDPVVRLELLLNPVELKIVGDIISESARRFQISDDLQEGWILIFVVMIFYHTNQLNSDAQVVNSFVLVQRYADLTLDILSVLRKIKILNE